MPTARNEDCFIDTLSQEKKIFDPTHEFAMAIQKA